MSEQNLPALSDDALLSDASNGLENVGAEDVAIPFLKIAQALSPELKKHDTMNFIEGLEEGDLFNSLDGTFYSGKQGVVVVPVAYRRTYLEWRPNRDGLEAVHDSSEILSQTTKGDRGQLLLENGNSIAPTGNHYIFILNEDGSYNPAQLSLAGSQLKKSKKWNAMMAGIKIRSLKGEVFTPATYSHKYQLTTGLETYDGNSWFGVDFSLLGRLDNDELSLYSEARNFAKSVSVETPTLLQQPRDNLEDSVL